MNIFRSYFKKFIEKFDNSEIKRMFCGIGYSIIYENSIKVLYYPFEPSKIYPEKELKSNEISAICLNSAPPFVKYQNDLIFISAEYKIELESFAKSNKIPLFESPNNWDYILEPFLDTEFTKENQEKNRLYLLNNGFDKDEILNLRKEVSGQMIKYNFDSMLWDWCNLGLICVLSAMRTKYNEKRYAEFYWRAMEIELRRLK